MKLPFTFCFCFFVIFGMVGISHANEIEYEHPNIGARVTLNDQGDIQSIRASGTDAFTFDDRSSINNSIRRAQMRAQSELAEFMETSISSDRTIDDMTEELRKQTTDEGMDAAQSNLETYTEVISTNAEAMLRGVIVLMEDINHDENYVTVEVGINQETIQAAGQLERDIESAGEPKAQDPQIQTDTQTEQEGREIRRSEMYDDF